MRAGRTAIGAAVGAICRRPRAWLAATLLATVGLGAWGLGIPIRGDMEDLLPEGTPAVQRARAAREILRSTSEVQVLIGAPGPAEGRAFAAQLAERFERHTELVDAVEHRRDISWFRNNLMLFAPADELDALHEELSAVIREAAGRELSLDGDLGLDGLDGEGGEGGDSGGGDGLRTRLPTESELLAQLGADDLREYFESADGTVIGVKVYPTFKPADTARTRVLNAALEADIAEARAGWPGGTFTVAMEGDYSQVTAAVDRLRGELVLTTLVALGAIALILFAWFRRLRALVVVLVPLAAGILWTFAFARGAVGYLNLISAFIFSILVGLGIDFVVHGVSRVDQELAGGKPLERALVDGLGGLGRPMTAAALTTVATFSSLALFDFRGFSQFGLLAAGGVVLCLLAVYLLLPALSMAMARDVSATPRRQRFQVDPVDRPLSRRFAWALLGALAVALVIAVPGIPGLPFEGDMRQMRSEDRGEASALKTRYRREAETRPASPALYITDSYASARALHRELERRRPDEPVIREVLSLYTFVPDGQEAKLGVIREMKRKIDNKYGLLEGDTKADADRLREFLDPTPYDERDVPRWVKDRFTDRDGHLGRYVFLYVNGVKSDARKVLEIEAAVGSVVAGGGTWHATAPWFLTGEAFRTVRQEGPYAVLAASLVVLLLLLLDLRALGAVLAAFLPLLSGFVLLLGALSGLGIPLNLFNIVVLPVIFGIGVDTNIHLIHRLRDGVPLSTVLRTTGGPAAVSALTTAAGFASLNLVSIPGVRSLGHVAVLGIACTFVSCIVIIAAAATLGWIPAARAVDPG